MPSGIPDAALVRRGDAAAVAEWVAERLLQARLDWPDKPLGLATGRTMEPVYRALVARVEGWPAARRDAVLKGWRSFNLDEYVGLGPEDPGAFTAEMRRQLGRPLGLEPRQLRLPDGLASDPLAEAAQYGAELRAAGGIGLQLLGLGLNGHVGFNEPPCGPQAACRCVLLSAATRAQNAAAFGADPAAVPSRAITLGLAEILAAQELLLVVTGAGKRSILARLLHGAPDPELPASWLQQHPRLSVVVDQAAWPG
ncbi:MAG: glucosamine-6-phosphate deaminase [Cyanobacteria bacterium M_surface_7_m2_040]|nr:glucosamine-6-phosphate deaminase [Cyanobacteria bacterium K_Offshore_0m_m2_072]MBM5809272.1 glucosamine-6-phosphate deaminase [Cyanobacteria bacterium M_surface_9_m1_291]MBM5828125.1 glucosamine-6-phosphate deaminase [Cyanobacteria bacterium M_surface_7_m2_040]